MKKFFIITAAFVLLAASTYAQPQGNRPEPPRMKTPEEMAREKADMMQSELSLDKKQYKKVYNLFKKDFEYRQQAMQDGFPGGMPPQGGGSGMGGPGGGMPPQGGGPGMGGGMMGGGMPPQGGGSGMGGGMPQQGGMPGGGMQQGERPEGGPGMGPGADLVTDEYLEKQDKKLRKILTPAQYDRWTAKHPAEHLELPPLEME